MMNTQHYGQMYSSHQGLDRSISDASEPRGFFDQMYVESTQAMEMNEASEQHCTFQSMSSGIHSRPDGPAERPGLNGHSGVNHSPDGRWERDNSKQPSAGSYEAQNMLDMWQSAATKYVHRLGMPAKGPDETDCMASMQASTSLPTSSAAMREQEIANLPQSREMDGLLHRMMMELHKENCTLKSQLAESQSKVSHLDQQLSMSQAALRRFQAPHPGPSVDYSDVGSPGASTTEFHACKELEQEMTMMHHPNIQGRAAHYSNGMSDNLQDMMRNHQMRESLHGNMTDRNVDRNLEGVGHMMGRQVDRQYMSQQGHGMPENFNQDRFGRSEPMPMQHTNGHVNGRLDPMQHSNSPLGMSPPAGISHAEMHGGGSGTMSPVSTTSSVNKAANANSNKARFWTDEEHERFLDAIKIFGYSNAQDIARYVGTRSATQVRTHAQKYFMKLCKGAGPVPKISG